MDTHLDSSQLATSTTGSVEYAPIGINHFTFRAIPDGKIADAWSHQTLLHTYLIKHQTCHPMVLPT